MKIAFACPSYGPIEPEVAHSQRAAIVHAWTKGIEVRADIFVDRAGWDVARNKIAWATENLPEDFKGVFWCDADTVLPQDAIVELVGPGVDICTGIYYARHPPYEPRIYVFNETAQAWNRILRWPEDGSLFPVHACGFGCVYTSRHALQLTQQVDLDTLPQEGQRFWFRTGKFSEDLSWCVVARRAGLIIWCNPAVVPDHLGEPIKVNREQYERWAKENGQTIVPAGMTLQRREDGTLDMVVVNDLNVAPEKTTAPPNVVSEELRMTPSA